MNNMFNNQQIYIFDQKKFEWFRYQNGEYIQSDFIPKPAGNWAGIGTKSD